MNDHVDWSALLVECRVQETSLAQRTWEAVQDPALHSMREVSNWSATGSRWTDLSMQLVQLGVDNPEHQLVRYQTS